MRTANCNPSGVISRRIAEMQLGDYDKRVAVYAMHDGEAIADAVIWVKDRFASLGAILPKLGFKH